MSELPQGPDTGHDYDGIREHDNVLPNWWLATLFLTIAFGFGYWAYDQSLGGPTSRQQYEAEIDAAAKAARERAKAKGEVTDDLLVQLSQAPATVAAGAATFKQTCAACHGAEGQGLIGPNLTDRFWLHGGKPTQILNTVSNGVVSKGMAAWEPSLGPDRVQEVVAYVLTLKGRNVPGKEPQGEPE